MVLFIFSGIIWVVGGGGGGGVKVGADFLFYLLHRLGIFDKIWVKWEGFSNSIFHGYLFFITPKIDFFFYLNNLLITKIFIFINKIVFANKYNHARQRKYSVQA